jgi:hypothetical protein
MKTDKKVTPYRDSTLNKKKQVEKIMTDLTVSFLLVRILNGVKKF